MKKLPQRTLEYNIGLVKYENPHQKDIFDLTTIHSLLIDQNPKFIELRQLIVDYNSRQVKRQINRPNLHRPFVERLYKMLSQVTRMYNSENQMKFLNKIYAWAFQERSENDNMNFGDESQDKMRPATASTKTRPYSAHTKKTRPDSGMISKQTKATLESEQPISKKVMDKYPNVDFKALKHGEKDFFLGQRTIHPQEEKPRVRLKEYQRKVFYDEPDEEDKFKQFAEEKPKPHIFGKQKLVEIPVEQEVPLPQQLKQGEQNLEKIGGQQGVQGAQGQDVGQDAGQQGALGEEVNIDDIAGGQQEAPAQQQPQEVDKLRPRVKVYGDQIVPIPREHMNQYHKGLKKDMKERNQLARKVEEDKVMIEMMQVWAATKNKVKMEQRRRAESARIMTRNPGIPFEKYIKKEEEDFKDAQVFDLTQAKVSQLKVNTRPISAFPAESTRIHNEAIKDAITTGKLSSHVTIPATSQTAVGLGDRLCTFAAKPKKKTFEQILKQAEQKVNRQTLDQIEVVKQKLANNRITLGGNKIFKSLSHHEPEVYDGQFMGNIIGQGMIKNPFIKVAKKKKKKKKK